MIIHHVDQHLALFRLQESEQLLPFLYLMPFLFCCCSLRLLRLHVYMVCFRVSSACVQAQILGVFYYPICQDDFNILYNVGGIWPVPPTNCTGYATENAVRIVDSFIPIPITRSYNHTQLLLTLLHVTLLISNYLCWLFYTISVDYRPLTVDYFCWRWSIDSCRWPIDCWLSYFDLLFCGFLWLPSHCLKKGLAGPKWEHLPFLFIYAV
jgi:hypothetical protein